MPLTRRHVLLMGGATVASCLPASAAARKTFRRKAQVLHVVYRRSGRRRRVSRAVKLRNANLVFDTAAAAAASKLHPGDRSKVVPITITDSVYQQWFGGGAHVVDLRVVYGRRPIIEGIAATSGPAGGGTSITVTGSNFENGAAVVIGNSGASGEATSPYYHVAAKTPALAPGTLNDVVVTNPNGLSGTLRKAWLADFSDVPKTYLFHNAVEKIFRAGITSGCGPGNYCPEAPVNRAAMAVFLLRGKHGSSYRPPPASGHVFGDVPLGTFLGDWIERLAAEGITTGCGGGNYCPTAPVTRASMAVFLLRAKHGSDYHPRPAAGNVFGDVPLGTFLGDWIEQLAAEQITAGCGGGDYCPNQPVTRGQMAVFLVKTFGLGRSASSGGGGGGKAAAVSESANTRARSRARNRRRHGPRREKRGLQPVVRTAESVLDRGSLPASGPI